MIDVTAAALVAELERQFPPGTVSYDEETDRVMIGSGDDSTSRISLLTFRAGISSGTPVNEVAGMIARICKQATEFAAHPAFNLEDAILHLVPATQIKDNRFVGTRLSPELATVLAFNYPDTVQIPSKESLAKTGITFENALSRATANLRRILEEHPGAVFDEDEPDVLGFDGDLAADRALLYAQSLPEATVLFADRDLAIVQPTASTASLARLCFIGAEFAKDPGTYTHPLSSSPHIFEAGKFVGIAIARIE